MTTAKETLGFQAEVKQLLHLMVHSLYGNKEIFLRELISNASDACDRLRFESVANGVPVDGDPEFRIRVSYDTTARTITVSDNGIGLSRQEVIDHIGTIAKSGTREFFQRLTADVARDAQLIGQFGVGFYSSFIVADRVTLVTRRAGTTADEGVRWESAGEGDYTVETVRKDARGTDVILHLRAEEDDLLSGSRLREILRKYSDHITFPILMKKEQWDSARKAQVVTESDEQVNQASALWARPKSEITSEQYEEFYRHVGHDFEPPLTWTHAKVEGRQEFTQLFYIPRRAPFDLWDPDRHHKVKLYVRRVFIMDSAEQLLPPYLRFVRGIVDSSDLPLNVSREILQQSSDVAQIRGASVKRVLALLEDLADNQKEKYATFWAEFGRVLKEGVIEDAANRERIASLLRFASTFDDRAEQAVSLADYVSRMKVGQDAIYYVTAEAFSVARNSPHLEVFRKHGVEVLLLTDRIDEWVVAHLTEFEGRKLQSAGQGDLDTSKLGEPSTRVADELKEDEYKGLLARIHDVLKERTSQVRLTRRLTDSPACVVADEHGMSRRLERILRESGQRLPATKPIFEINPDHPIVQRLKREPDETLFADWTHILFDQALLAEGAELEDPAVFVRRLNKVTLALAGGAVPRIWTPGS
ncbi:MAG: molecular chaperone HtpG [Acidobacteria bacterium]|nr:MAG: molecular chaperone HtpG [Acidobacteriota bacterium]PYR21427.1 MAG: molecular chaperone HtpG [Acidobacteriota bacterium]PYR52985.1 MAG: molecular chaperone HtpG [Acidobacteriota bacterium]